VHKIDYRFGFTKNSKYFAFERAQHLIGVKPWEVVSFQVWGSGLVVDEIFDETLGAINDELHSGW